MTSDISSPEWLHQSLGNTKIRIIDCRWVLGKQGEGRRQYEAGHIPGAVHLDVDQDLSAKEGPGRHPLPLPRDFGKTMSAVGVARETHVVVYDEGIGASAARLWWLLRYYGHDKVSVLDGGWVLWTKEGRTTETAVPTYPATSFAARPKRRWVVDKLTVDSLRDEARVLLIDARVSERYRGEVEPIDPKAGHIPGAENFPYTKNIDPETGRFLTPEKLKNEYDKIGTTSAKTIICYCGSGITACSDILGLKLVGLDAKLYEGSWGDWSRDPKLPVATPR